MLSDLLNIITLHAHCIYVYAAMYANAINIEQSHQFRICLFIWNFYFSHSFSIRLYHIEVVGLLALWRVVSGRRKNILKGMRNNHRNDFKSNLI